MDPNLILNRVMRLARLDTSVFDEVRDDANELVPAIIVAAISCLLAGIGSFLYWQIGPGYDGPEKIFINTLLLGTIFMIAIYAVAILVVYVMMAQVYKVQADLYSLFRTMGYAAIPLSLSVLMFLPVVFPLFALAPLGLLLVFMIYAVQSATNADSDQVVMASFTGFAVMCLILGLIAVSTSGFTDAPAGAGVFGLLVDFS